MKVKLLIAILIGFLACPNLCVRADEAGLYHRFNGKSVKVHLAPVKDSTADHKVDPARLHKGLEEALRARKSIRFVMVPRLEEAEILIEADIKDFMWTDHDPVDMITGIGGTAADAVIVEDYAKLHADVRVTDVSKNKVIWQRRVRATKTKKPMSEAESIPLIIEDFAKTFIRECFGKPRGR
jgi:hypothetical protein